MTITNKYIRMDSDQNNWIDLIKWVSAWVSGTIATVWGFNRFINEYFEYKKAQQRKFVEDIIESRVNPEITELRESIDQLKEAIWELKNKIKT